MSQHVYSRYRNKDLLLHTIIEYRIYILDLVLDNMIDFFLFTFKASKSRIIIPFLA